MTTTNLPQEAATLSAMRGAARIWLGLDAAGRVVKFWTTPPVDRAYEGMRLVEYVCTPAGAPAAPVSESQPAGLRVTLRGGGSHMPLEVWGEECLAGEFGAFRFAVHHKLWHDALSVDRFTVTSIDGGYIAGHGNSVEEAIADARAKMSTITLEEFAARVERAKQGLPAVPAAPATSDKVEGV